jgi:hypothetical protein
MLAANTALLAHLQGGTTTTAITSQQESIPPAATLATEGGKDAPEPPIHMLHDDPDSPETEIVDFVSYGKVTHAGQERPPRDIDEPRLWAITDDMARALSEKKTHATNDEHLHIECCACFDTFANSTLSGGMDALSAGHSMSHERMSNVALIIVHNPHRDGGGHIHSIGHPPPHHGRTTEL